MITGVLASQQQAMDIKIEQFSMSVYGKEFIKDHRGSLLWLILKQALLRKSGGRGGMLGQIS